jgi:hypothetical protein
MRVLQFSQVKSDAAQEDELGAMLADAIDSAMLSESDEESSEHEGEVVEHGDGEPNDMTVVCADGATHKADSVPIDVVGVSSGNAASDDAVEHVDTIEQPGNVDTFSQASTLQRHVSDDEAPQSPVPQVCSTSRNPHKLLTRSNAHEQLDAIVVADDADVLTMAELDHAFDGLGEIMAAGFGQLRPNDVFGAAADTPEDSLVLNYYMRVMLFEGFASAAAPLWKLSG